MTAEAAAAAAAAIAGAGRAVARAMARPAAVADAVRRPKIGSKVHDKLTVWTRDNFRLVRKDFPHNILPRVSAAGLS